MKTNISKSKLPNFSHCWKSTIKLSEARAGKQNQLNGCRRTAGRGPLVVLCVIIFANSQYRRLYRSYYKIRAQC